MNKYPKHIRYNQSASGTLFSFYLEPKVNTFYIQEGRGHSAGVTIFIDPSSPSEVCFILIKEILWRTGYSTVFQRHPKIPRACKNKNIFLIKSVLFNPPWVLSLPFQTDWRFRATGPQTGVARPAADLIPPPAAEGGGKHWLQTTFLWASKLCVRTRTVNQHVLLSCNGFWFCGKCLTTQILFRSQEKKIIIIMCEGNKMQETSIGHDWNKKSKEQIMVLTAMQLGSKTRHFYSNH